MSFGFARVSEVRHMQVLKFRQNNNNKCLCHLQTLITVSFLVLGEVGVVLEGPVAERALVRGDVGVDTHVTSQLV